MKFEVYCDEAMPDLFTSRHPRARHMMIGSLWLPANLRGKTKDKIAELRAKHDVWGEIKWTKISPSKQVFYEELIDMFMSFGMDMRFRCIAIDREHVNLASHNDDDSLGIYRFYYHLLRRWVGAFNEYCIFCDLKTNRDRRRLRDLQHCLDCSNRYASVARIQSLPSSGVAPLQMCDVLLGIASSRINQTLGAGTAKEAVVQRLERFFDGTLDTQTSWSGDKFNVFKIHLNGGW